ADDGIRAPLVTGVQTCALPIWVPARRLRARQLFERQAGFLEQRQGRLLVRVVALNEPEHADGMVQLPLPAPLVLLPQSERARREIGRASCREREETPLDVVLYT